MRKAETTVNTNEKADSGQNARFPEGKQRQTTRKKQEEISEQNYVVIPQVVLFRESECDIIIKYNNSY